ncbi:MAG TPA: hypothetical protein VGC07_02390 [Granulicella sp.]
MSRLRYTVILALTAFALGTAQAPAQTATPAQTSDSASSTPHNWTTEQIVTATVHQAWLLAGKDENAFFEIIQELTAISAKNRNLVLPDDAAIGKKAGEHIRKKAQADHDQLLYAIVDESVRMTGKPAPAAAGQ